MLRETTVEQSRCEVIIAYICKLSVNIARQRRVDHDAHNRSTIVSEMISNSRTHSQETRSDEQGERSHMGGFEEF